MYVFILFFMVKNNKIVGFTGLPVCLSVAGTDVNHDVVFSFARGLPSLSMPSKEKESHFCSKCGWTRAQGSLPRFQYRVPCQAHVMVEHLRRMYYSHIMVKEEESEARVNPTKQCH